MMRISIAGVARISNRSSRVGRRATRGEHRRVGSFESLEERVVLSSRLDDYAN